MIIDSKLPNLKSFIGDNRLNNGGLKTTIDQSAVAASDQAGVDLNLQDDEHESSYDKSKKKKKDKQKDSKDNAYHSKAKEKTDAEVKSMNMKLLNLL